MKINMESIVLAMDKLFYLISNYSKGNMEAFRIYVEEYYPDSLLYHVSNTKGNQQDIICICVGLGYMNRSVYIEYLDKWLRAHDKSNTLEENMYILLSSQSTTAIFRLFSIIDLSIVIPMK